MENEFAKVMSERTDEDLIEIVTVERTSYNPTAIKAADLEVEKRKIDTSEFKKIREQAKIEKEKVDSNIAGSGIHFVSGLLENWIYPN